MLSSAVYFNPAKTKGGMIEADVFCLVGLLYSAFVCLSSMSLFWWLELQPGWEWLGDLVAIVWIGVSMSAVAWAKVWMVCGIVSGIMKNQTYYCVVRLVRLSTPVKPCEPPTSIYSSH